MNITDIPARFQYQFKSTTRSRRIDLVQSVYLGRSLADFAFFKNSN